MKNLRLVFEEEEYSDLLKAKGKLGWREFILKLAKVTKRS